VTAACGDSVNLKARPVAVIHATATDNRVEPVLGFTQIGLTAIATALFLVVWVVRLARGPGGDLTPQKAAGQIKKLLD
jgi:hypothetical protein